MGCIGKFLFVLRLLLQPLSSLTLFPPSQEFFLYARVSDTRVQCGTVIRGPSNNAMEYFDGRSGDLMHPSNWSQLLQVRSGCDRFRSRKLFLTKQGGYMLYDWVPCNLLLGCFYWILGHENERFEGPQVCDAARGLFLCHNLRSGVVVGSPRKWLRSHVSSAKSPYG